MLDEEKEVVNNVSLDDSFKYQISHISEDSDCKNGETLMDVLSIEEFNLFLNDVGLNEYKHEFERHYYNYISILAYLTELILIDTIKMKYDDAKHFMKCQKLWLKKVDIFDVLLRKNNLYRLYYSVLQQYSIYTIEAFVRIDNKYNMLSLITNKATHDCSEQDYKTMKRVFYNYNSK